jgi:PrtD family type I secretion system ABC transporter
VTERDDLRAVRRSFRGSLAAVGLVSGLLNVLMLTGSFYMLEIYDRVVPSRSLPTLLGLTVLATVLFFFQGFLEFLRGRVLVHVGAALDQRISGPVFQGILHLPLMRPNGGEGLLPLRDLDQLRNFFGGTGLSAFFDLPWVPVYLAVCFVFHPAIGFAASAAGVVLLAITLTTEFLTRGPTKKLTTLGSERFASAESARRNADVIRAMGMANSVGARWAAVNGDYLSANLSVAKLSGTFGSFAKSFRMLLQSLVLGMGAFLVIYDQASGGIIIAGSILTARALAPIDQAIANWKMLVAARQSWSRLCELLNSTRPAAPLVALPAPKRDASLEGISVAPPGDSRVVVADVSISMKAGSGLGIIGSSASGKTSLLKTLVGVWPAARGAVRLDGAKLDQFSPEALGKHIGYLPQDVELFSDTIARNIARFEPRPDSGKVIAAAEAAGAHEIIKRLPQGYDTQIGQSGNFLSAGQRQRIALARALYGDPFLVVLDEPNSNLDTEGEQALLRAMASIRERGGIIVVAAHRLGALDAVDHLLVLAGGRVQSFGPKAELLAEVARRSGKTGDRTGPFMTVGGGR